MADEAEVDSSANIKNNGSRSSRTPETSGDEYEVDRIIGMCKTKGKTLYKVRWVGYDPSWDTWEPAENLETCIDVIQAYLQQKKEQKHKAVKSRKVSITENLDKDIFSPEETSQDGSVTSSNTSESSDKKRKKSAWKYVSSSDDEADTLKDKFWRDLEQGKVDVFQNDMYSKVKGEGTRTSRPESFKEMYKTKRLVQESDQPDTVKKKRRSGERKSTESSTSQESVKNRKKSVSSQESVKIEGNESASSHESVKIERKESASSHESVKISERKKSVSESSAKVTKQSGRAKARTLSSEALAEMADIGGNRVLDSLPVNTKKVTKPKNKGKKEKTPASLKGKGSASKKKTKDTSGSLSDPEKVIVKTEIIEEEEKSTMVLMTEIKTEPVDDENFKSDQFESASSSPRALERSGVEPQKDTFWRDLDEGKVNVFSSADMYSKVKSYGRAAWPKSFTADPPKEKRPGNVSQNWKDTKEVKKTRISSDLKKNLMRKGVKPKRDRTPESGFKNVLSLQLSGDAVTKDNHPSDVSNATTPESEGQLPELKAEGGRLATRYDSVSSEASIGPPVLVANIQVEAKDAVNVLGKCAEVEAKDAVNVLGKYAGVEEKHQTDTEKGPSTVVTGTDKMGVVGLCSNVALLLEADPKLVKCKVLLRPLPKQYSSRPTTNTVRKDSQLQTTDAPQLQRQVLKKSRPKSQQSSKHKESEPELTVSTTTTTACITGKALVTKGIDSQSDSQIHRSWNSELSNSGSGALLERVGCTTDAPVCISSAVSDDRSCSKPSTSTPAGFKQDDKPKDSKQEVKNVKRKRKHSTSEEKPGSVSSKKGRLVGNSDTEMSDIIRRDSAKVKDSDVISDLKDVPNLPSRSSGPDIAMDYHVAETSSTRDQHLPPSATSPPGVSVRVESNSSHIDEVPLGSPQTGPHSNYSVQSCDSGVDISHERSFGLNMSSEGKDTSTAEPGVVDSRKQAGRTATEQGGSDKQLDFIDFDFELDPSVQQNVKPAPTLEHVADMSTGEFRHAIKRNEFEKVRLALTRRRYDLEQADCNGVTLTMYCAMRGLDDMLELLVKNGANVNAETKNGASALIMACEQGLRCTVELLLLLGAYVNKSTANSGETALIKSVKRGHIHIVRSLLNQGCNFSSPISEHNAVKFAKAYNQVEIMNLLNDHVHRVTTEMESQVLNTLNNTARIINQLFGLQCMALRETTKFKISFKHELEATESGLGMLLFISHARVSATEVKCRFYGPCAVTSAFLNGTKLHPLTKDGNFVMSFCPLHNGKNDLEINTVAAPTSKAKLLICAYKAQLNSQNF